MSRIGSMALALSAVLMPGLATADDAPVTSRMPDGVTVRAEDIDLSGAGDCRSERGNVNMLAVVFLPGDSATMNDGSTRLRVSFTYDRVDIGELSQPERGTRWFEVTRLVGADSDVRLRFARVNGSIMLYWRETAEHSGSYKQGLLSIRTHQLTPVCRGTGGIWRVLH